MFFTLKAVSTIKIECLLMFFTIKVDSTFKIECLFIEKVDSTIKIECLLMLFHSKRVAPYIPKIAKTQMKKQEHYTFGNITNPLQVELMEGGFP